MELGETEEMELYAAFLESEDSRVIAPPVDGTPKVRPDVDRAYGWRLWEGYLNAAGILITQSMKSEDLAARLIFPALFNLRHALEIALKWHIEYAGGSIPKRAGHDLAKLVEAFRLTAEGLDDDINYLPEYVLSCALELAALDPGAVAFRYPGEASAELKQNAPTEWDLTRLSFVIDTMSLYLDGLSGQIDLSQNEDYIAGLRAC